MDVGCRAKWDRTSRLYDLMNRPEERRYGRVKRSFFAKMRGRCLMLAAGTGLDFRFFPSGCDVTAIDISRGMVEQARRRAAAYDGTLRVLEMDAQALAFAAESFDTVVTSCTFCSVPDPMAGLAELRRCLRPGGTMLMFEHVRSRLGPIAIMQDLMTPLSRRSGPEMNRDTLANVMRAGFRIVREDNVFLDIIKTIEATRP